MPTDTGDVVNEPSLWMTVSVEEGQKADALVNEMLNTLNNLVPNVLQQRNNFTSIYDGIAREEEAEKDQNLNF